MHWRDPFRVRSFRFQWPADLTTSWAMEMETIVLGWFILVESGSVMMLVVFGSLQYLGSLVSPMFGVAGDRLGYRRMLVLSRALYALLAAAFMLLAWLQALTPMIVLIMAALAGLVRPSDMMMRHALIAQTLPPRHLLGTLGISRITSDSARIAGALAGAGVVAWLGMTWAYALITALYMLSFVLSRGVSGGPAQTAVRDAPRVSLIRDLQLAFGYVWTRPVLIAAMALAFLVNLLAFPFSLGLLPYVAKNIYLTDQTGLGWLGASFAFGGLVGSVVLSSHRFAFRAAQTMVLAGAVWFAVDVLFAFSTHLGVGMALLCLAGLAQSLSMTPLAAVMLRATEPAYRGRVMGMRMLAIWGLPLGLLLSGPLIGRWGYVATASMYSALGLLLTGAMAVYWRAHIWDRKAPANAPL
ncbi:MFS transporter [Limnohabitans sp. Rim8]|uniref:MFS transporter n=1 Tax=Limnohabitans sp. Rim8 TaxID=1100718 RepID=UPI0025E2F58A|nr:MFS transporter [Limnohabitans sp. Rim8]